MTRNQKKLTFSQKFNQHRVGILLRPGLSYEAKFEIHYGKSDDCRKCRKIKNPSLISDELSSFGWLVTAGGLALAVTALIEVGIMLY